MCKVSVVIPVYNVEKTIERCLVSVIDQTFTDYEIILVNDGTKDNSMVVIEKYLSDERISVVNQENKGLPQTRRSGFLNAKGKYVFFIDSDDYIEKNTLELLVDAAEKNDADIVCCNIRGVSPDGHSLFTAKKTGEYTSEEAIKSINQMNGVYQYVWNKLYKRELISDSDFPNGHFIGEDYATVISIIPKAKKIYHISDYLYNYVYNPNSMTSTGFCDMYIQAYNQNKKAKEILMHKYPALKKDITAYHILQEMGIINAMFRIDVYDENIKKEITTNIRKNWATYVFNTNTSFFYKVCVFTAAISMNLYKKIYKKVYSKKGHN